MSANTEATLQRAEAMIEVHRPLEAISVLGPLLAYEPGLFKAWCLLARAQLEAKRPAEALESAGRALSLAPDSEWAHRLASVTHSGLDQAAPAVAHARESVRLAPQSWRAHARLAMAVAQDDPTNPEAGRAAANAVRLAPGEAETHFAVGFAAAKAGDQVLAEQAYRHCLEIKPDHSGAQNNLGVIQLNQGRLLRSATEFATAAASDPRMDHARRNIDVAARRLARRFHLAVLAIWLVVIVLLNRSNGPTGVASSLPTGPATTGPLLAVSVLCVIGLVVAGWNIHRRLPRVLRSYLRTLPGRDRLLAAWLALDLMALAALIAVPFVSPAARDGATSVAIVCLFAGAGLAIWARRRSGAR